MSNNKEGKYLPAPYPPLVTRVGKGRAGAGAAARPIPHNTHQSTNKTYVPNKNIKKSGQASVNYGGSGPQMKRQFFSQVKYYNNTIYGAVNCLGHACDATTDYQNQAQVQSASSASAMRMNKVGPVLLELRYLIPRHNSDENEEYKQLDPNSNSKSIYSFYRGETIAISRGISALGVGVASTCLSFRQPSLDHSLSSNYNNEIAANIQAATGLTSGALCIHNMRNINEYINMNLEEEEHRKNGDNKNDDNQKYQWNVLDSANSDDAAVCYFSHYQTRNHRPASAVAWRGSSSNTNHVAIGYNSSSDRVNPGSTRGSAMSRAGLDSGTLASSKDREYGALVWDVEAQGAASKGVKQLPLHKLAHNSSVASLSWISADGELLAVGCQSKNLQIYDLRISGTSAQPLSTSAHESSVNGIEVDPNRPNVFATFSRALAEPVKLWDIRKMNSCVSEIKTGAITASHNVGDLPTFVSAIGWEQSSPGILSIVTGDDLRFYNTRINISRPVLTRMTHSRGDLQCISFPSKHVTTESNAHSDLGKASHATVPERMLAVYTDGSVRDLPLQQVSPVALSSRDGRVANAFGSILCFGSTIEGPTAMENVKINSMEDISATMLRRARCLHMTRYSTDASSNLQMLSTERDTYIMTRNKTNNSGIDLDCFEDMQLQSLEHLWNLWSWIERVEKLCFRSDSAMDESFWPGKTLCDSGVIKLLRLDVSDVDDFETSSKSAIFNHNVYDSPLRRAVLTACGWTGKFNLKDVLQDTESHGNFERSAALACWHGDLGAAVAALQRGSAYIRDRLSQKEETSNRLFTSEYSETLELVAMCIAGYHSGGQKEISSASVWKTACRNLLNRPSMTDISQVESKTHANYLRAICSFLIDDNHLDKTLNDESLNLSDRVAFACIYLGRKELKDHLDHCVNICLRSGNLEGILITGLNKQGIALLQSYVDSRSDVQTAALVSSRAIFPVEWVKERVSCSSWLETYREFLNKNQMWQSRAMFDVGRIELLRKLRDRQHAEEQPTLPAGNRLFRRPAQQMMRRQLQVPFNMKQNDNDTCIPSFPPQIYARCNYCNTSLPLAKLRKQENIANNWLSRQKPLLSCCPNAQCRKPLPRCAICLLPLGCLNPYMELRWYGQQNRDDLSALANLPFAEWFTWCATCHHGGHAHHYASWFASHETCPVSNCDCRCQFDVIQKLKRPALCTERNPDEEFAST